MSAVLFCPECLKYSCEQTLFNAPGEALALTDAARLFLTSEKENWALQAPGFDEHLQAALNCYSFAIKVQHESANALTISVTKRSKLCDDSVYSVLCPVPPLENIVKSEENRDSDLVSLDQWFQVYIEMNQPVMAASLCLELGNALKVKL